MTAILGTPDADVIYVPIDGDYEVFAGAGDDTITIQKYTNRPGVITVDAGDGDDKINVQVYGGRPVTVDGGAGADTFELEAGGVVRGGAGADVFVISRGSYWPTSTIADFSAEDRVDLLPFLRGQYGWVEGTDPFAAGLARLIQVGADTVIQTKSDDIWAPRGILLNQDATKLTAAQFSGLKPVVAATPVLASMSLPSTTMMEGGAMAIDISLTRPVAQDVTVSLNNSSFVQTAVIKAGQTKVQIVIGFGEDRYTADPGEGFIWLGASGGGVAVDPHPAAWTAQISVKDNDVNGFSVALPVTSGEAYRQLTLLDGVKPSDAANVPSLHAFTGTRDVVRALEPFAISTTSVALTAYQFFTGKSPGQAGLKYLVNSPDNASDLNDAAGIYTGMNTENRYINFAANLGLVGEGKAAFAAGYQTLTFRQAVEKAYDAIIGKAYAQAAGIDVTAAINGVVAAKTYFDAVANERMGSFDHELAVKAGMIGYLIAEGQKAHVGIYARAVENFYLDLMDSTAQHNVDLVAVYGPGTFLDAL